MTDRFDRETLSGWAPLVENRGWCSGGCDDLSAVAGWAIWVVSRSWRTCKAADRFDGCDDLGAVAAAGDIGIILRPQWACQVAVSSPLNSRQWCDRDAFTSLGI